MMPGARPGCATACARLGIPSAVPLEGSPEMVGPGIQGSSPPALATYGSSLFVVSRARVPNFVGSLWRVATAASARVLASTQAWSVEGRDEAEEVS